MIRYFIYLLYLLVFLYLSYGLLTRYENPVPKQTLKKERYQFVIVNPLRGNIYDVKGMPLTSTDFVYKMVYKLRSPSLSGKALPNNILYDEKNCVILQDGITVVCSVSPYYLYENFEFLQLFKTNVYPVFKRTKNFVDYDIDFAGTATFAEGKRKTKIIRKIIKKLKKKIPDKKHLRRVSRILKSMDIIAGNWGLELYYDSIMRGEIGVIKRYTDKSIIINDKQNGADIYLTLDIQLQGKIKDELKKFCKKLNTNCAAIGMNAENGEILFFTEVKKENLGKETKQFYFSNIYQGLYAPGSLLKPFISLLLLEKNVISRDTKTFCGGKIKVYHRIFSCWNSAGHGNVDVVSAIEQSCNIFFYENIQKLTNRDLSDFIEMFRLNKKAGVDLPNEIRGKVSVAVNPLNKILFSIGQSDIYISLLKLAQLYSIFYNKQFMPVGHLVKDRKHVRRIHIKIDPRNIEIVRKGLYNVVHSRTGTAHNVGLEKYNIYGKTGTVQVGTNLKPHSMFCGVWEGKIPVSFCVIIEHAGSGREFAARFTNILIEILDKFLK